MITCIKYQYIIFMLKFYSGWITTIYTKLSWYLLKYKLQHNILFNAYWRTVLQNLFSTLFVARMGNY